MDYGHIQKQANSELMRARILMFNAVESGDAAGALEACKALVAFLEAHPDMRLDVVPLESEAPTFTMPATVRTMVARFNSKCSVCTNPISQGTPMHWDLVRRRAICMRCSAPELP